MSELNKRLMLTGATGFVGSSLYQHLLATCKYRVRLVVRDISMVTPNLEVEVHQSGDMSAATSWADHVNSTDVVIHCAARVHIMNETIGDPLTMFRAVNVNSTLNLARQCAASGVKRFIFLSSIKVNGEETELERPYLADDEPRPLDPYGISKMEAEQGLRLLAAQTGMEVVIIRPVLVYGPGVKANFRNMMTWLRKGLPLPLGSIKNKRSLVALENLVDLIVTCIDHPAAANQTFLVSDGEDLSTPGLLHRMARALGKRGHLLPIPVFLIHAGASLIGKKNVAQRLCGSLQVDITKTRKLLDWTPPVSVDSALHKTAKAFLASTRR